MLRRRVLLVEDHPMYRQGLRRLLEDSGRFQVIAEAENGHKAIHMADVYHPDLILLDVHLPGVTGLKIARVLRKLDDTVKIVFLSMQLDDDRLLDAIRVGAGAFLTKDLDPESLLDALRRVATGENLLNQLVIERPQLAWRILTEFRSLANEGEDAESREQFHLLSAREIEVLDCVAQGLTNREIADELFVTEQTVKNHMTAVLRKLGVNDRVQAVLHAARQGWIEIGPRSYAAATIVQTA